MRSSIAAPIGPPKRKREWRPISAATDTEDFQPLYDLGTNEPATEVNTICAYTEGSSTQPFIALLTKQEPSLHGRIRGGVFIASGNLKYSFARSGDFTTFEAGLTGRTILPQISKGRLVPDTRTTTETFTIPVFLFLPARNSVSHDLSSAEFNAITSIHAQKLKWDESISGISRGHSHDNIDSGLALFYGGGFGLTLLGILWFAAQLVETLKGVESFFSRGEALFGMCGMIWLALELLLALQADMTEKK